MKERNVILFLSDVIEAINKIERYIDNLDYNSFEKNELVIDAVIRNLEVIGEASKNVPKNIREEYSDLPWKRIIGLRNIAIHSYFKIDLTIIWNIITKNIPQTKTKILKIKEDLIKP